MNNNERYYNNHTFKLSIICRKCKIRFVNPLLLPTDAHNVKKRRVIKTFRPMTTTHFLSWRPYHVTLCNLLNTVYLHTVHDTHALQGKSDFIPLLSNLLFISLNFYSHSTYISFITVTICSHSTDDALHIFYADTVNQTCNF